MVPGSCATGSACANNPATVDVTPNGPLTLCAGTGQLLTAGLTGGTGPFTYQWYEDGIADRRGYRVDLDPEFHRNPHLQLQGERQRLRDRPLRCLGGVDHLEGDADLRRPFVGGHAPATRPAR